MIEPVNHSGMTFAEYMNAVDREISAKTFGMLTHHDLEDYLYRDCFDDGLEPSETALNALEHDDLASAFLEDMDGE